LLLTIKIFPLTQQKLNFWVSSALLGIIFLFHTTDVGAFQPSKISLPTNSKSLQTELLFPRYRNLEPRIALVLSGGGARGIAHIGILKVLEENNIPIHYIAGTSMGSIVGGLFASGYSADEIWLQLSSILWQEIIEDKPQRTSLLFSKKQSENRHLLQIRLKGTKPYIPPAISPGQKMYNLLYQLVLNAPYHATNNYDNLKIPFRSVATDLIRGKTVLFDHGDLAQVMLASSAIPLLFSPVSIDTFLLVDGGVLANIPVPGIVEFDPDLIISIDTTSPLRPKDKILLPWQLADQVTTIMQVSQKNKAKKESDIVITPNLRNRTNTDFDSLEIVYQAGIDACRKSIGTIKKAIQNIVTTENFLDKKYYIANLTVNGSHNFEKNGFLPEVGTSVEKNKILDTFQSLYNSGLVDSVYGLEVDSNAVEIFVTFSPILEKIKFTNNQQLSDSLLASIMRNKTGKSFNIHTWQLDREDILKLYRKNDFPLARIYKETFDRSLGILSIFIDEGKIESVDLSGNKRTRSSIILKEYGLKKGDYFRNSLSLKGVTNLYGMGLFDRVQPEYTWRNDKLYLNLRVGERPSTLVILSYNFSKDYEFQSLFQWLDHNLFGLGNQIKIGGIAGKRHLSGDLEIQFNQIFNSDFSFQFHNYSFQKRLYAFSQGDISGEYKEQRTGLRASFGKQLRRDGLLSTEFSVEKIRLKPVFGFGFPDYKDNLVSLKLQWVVDSLDKLPFPKNGRYNLFYYKMSPQFFGNRKSFFKIYSRFESYYSFLKRWTVSPKIVWAAAENTTPFPEFFDMGNNDHFYGFRLNELRGRRLIRANLELRYFMPSKIPIDTYFSIRYDLGAIWKNSSDQIVSKDFISGIGAKISFDLILGVFSFSYGENSKNRKDLSFDLGFQF